MPKLTFRCFSLWCLVGAVAILSTGWLGAGCANRGGGARASQTSVRGPTPGVELERQLSAPNDRALVNRRATIDSAGRAANCQALAAANPTPWLGAWCGFQTHQWALSARKAQIAGQSYAARGLLRRQIEMLLLEAISRHRLAAQAPLTTQQFGRRVPSMQHGIRNARAQALAERAHQLWQNSRMPMHADLRDRHGGDLSYLYAVALRDGLLEDVKTPDGAPLQPTALLDIARNEYRDFARFGALSRTLRAAHQLALERGEPERAMRALERAFVVDLEYEQQSALGEDLALFEQFNAFLGRDKPTAHAPGLSRFDAQPEAARAFATYTMAQFRDLLAYPTGRSRLADFIAWTRASPTRAIAPPRPLMQVLRKHADLGSWRGQDWRMAFQGGALLAEHGLSKPAKRYFKASIAAIEAMRASLPTPALRQRFFADKRKVYMALVDAYIGLDTDQRTQANYRHSLYLANALKARGLLDLLDGHLDPALATEARSTTRRASASRSRSTRARANRALAQLQNWSAPQPAGLGRRSERPQVTSPHHRRPRKFSDTITTHIPADTVLLEYLIMPRRSYLWVLSDQGIKMRQLAGREELEPLVEAFLATLGETNSNQTGFKKTGSNKKDAPSRQRKLAERLYVELIGPAQDLLKSVDRLIIAPDGKLYDLPFEMLAKPTRSPSPDYMMFNQVLTYTPSSAVFERLMTRNPPSKPATNTTRALLIGAADLDRAAIDLLKLTDELPGSGMFSLQDIFPQLPGARAELRHIHTRLDAQQYEVEMRVGQMAAESWMRNADLSQYGIIHVAAHGISDARSLQIAGVQSDLEFTQPALLLSRDPDQPDDGIVTLGELLNRRTAAEMVVLSGCTTGRGWQTLGAGAFGLAGAVLYTGSSSVVASMWSVEDSDTSKLMAAFYRGIAEGKTPAQALQSGQIAMSKAGMSPASWAAFRVIGGG